jgi:hypothetical protein
MDNNFLNTCSGPNFLSIGAQKCGTTWLSAMICKHPEVSKITTKELQYFNKPKNFEKGEEWYIKNFTVSQGTKAVGEFTPNYFWTYDDNPEIAKKNILDDLPRSIYNFNPNMKLVLLLRNPIDRAVSAYYHHIKNGRISPKEKFSKAKYRYGIISMGFYDIHLKNWLKFFPIENFLILFYDTDLLDENKLDTIKRVYKHIGVDENFVPDNVLKKFNSQNTYFEIQTKYYMSRFGKFTNRITPGFVKNHSHWKKNVHSFEVQSKINCAKLGKLICMFTPGFIKNHKYWKINVFDTDLENLKEIYKPHIKSLSVLLNKDINW